MFEQLIDQERENTAQQDASAPPPKEVESNWRQLTNWQRMAIVGDCQLVRADMQSNAGNE